MIHRILFALCLLVPMGCNTVTSTVPPAAVAPGYASPADQQLGQDLAAVNKFVASEKGNYSCDSVASAAQTCLTPAQQTAEKPYLNGLVTATDAANTVYLAYHAGTQTLAQAQAAVATAKTSMSSLATAKGVN